MSKIQKLEDLTSEEVLLLGEGEEQKRYEPAIIGMAYRFGIQPIVAYDYQKVIDILAEDIGHEDAREYFDYNILGAWVGEATPIFIEIIE